MHVIRNLMAILSHQNFARKIFVTLPKICFFRDYASNWYIVSEWSGKNRKMCSKWITLLGMFKEYSRRSWFLGYMKIKLKCCAFEQLKGAQQAELGVIFNLRPKISTWKSKKIIKAKIWRQPDRQKIMPMALFMKFVIQWHPICGVRVRHDFGKVQKFRRWPDFLNPFGSKNKTQKSWARARGILCSAK